jgi:hypothetical protein
MGAYPQFPRRIGSLLSLAVAMLVGAPSLSGCSQADTAKFQNLRWADVVGRDANCNGKVESAPLDPQSYDINGDGAVDWFVTLRCSGQDIGDQLEIFDGASNADHPKHLDAVPLIHQRAGIRLDGGCLMFSGYRVFVARPSTAGGISVRRVVKIGQWDQKTDTVTGAPPGATMTVPCGSVASNASR